MTPSQPITRYSAPAMLLHWLLALAIFTSLGVGLYMTGLPFSMERLRLYNWHKWAGIVILVLSVLRLLWRLVRKPPALPRDVEAAMPHWQLVAYKGTHHAMYALFLLIPLAGWAYTSATGFPVVLFGIWLLPDFVPKDQALAELLKTAHAWLAFALIGLVALHIAAALKHHFFDRDGLLLRMLPQRRSSKPSRPASASQASGSSRQFIQES